jgi:hypothetical protein
MSTNPLAPRMLKGALVGLDPMDPLAGLVVFQYNPDTMTRRLEPRTSGSPDAERSEALRLVGPPKETITLSVEFDAADLPLGAVQAIAGIYPPLAALEMLLYPKTLTVIKNEALAATGILEIIPPTMPLTLFVWGPARVVPVRLTSLSITEEQHDAFLTPTRGKAELSMQVLSYHDVGISNVGHALFLAHQITKEAFAITNLASAGNQVVGIRGRS